jgi:hypothetical protein
MAGFEVTTEADGLPQVDHLQALHERAAVKIIVLHHQA